MSKDRIEGWIEEIIRGFLKYSAENSQTAVPCESKIPTLDDIESRPSEGEWR